MINFSLDEYKDKLFKIDYNKEYYTDVTPFGNFDEIFFKTNENLHEYEINKLENKKILTVTASLDQALYTVLKGAKDITCFDINCFTKLYANLKMAMIKAFNYDDFIYLLLRFKNEKNIFSKCIVSSVEKYLSKDEIDFWLSYDKYRNIEHDNDHIYINKSLFIYDDDNLEYTPYNSLENYNKLKDQINDVRIKYLDCGISNIKKHINDDKFDAILLSNIMSYIQDYDVFKSILNEIVNILEKDGKVYLFDVLKDVSLNKIIKYSDSERLNLSMKETNDLQTLYVLKRSI